MATHSPGALAPVPEPTSPAGRPRLIPAEPKRPRSAGIIVTVSIFVIAAAAGAWYLLRPTEKQTRSSAAATRTVTVRKASLRKSLRVAGVTVAGRFNMLLAPTMAGARTGRSAAEFQQVLEKVVKGGTHVKKGDVVAQFDQMYMLLRLDDYRSNVIQHQANLRSLNAMLDVRRKGYEQTTIRYRGARDKSALEIKKSPVLSAIKAENNQLNLQQYAAQLKEIIDEERYFEISEKSAIRRSELDLRVSRMEYDRAKRNSDSMIVHSPIDGMVVMQTIRRGSDVNEIRDGDQLYPGQPYMQIVDTNSICVDASVNQTDIDEVRVGAPARVSFDAYPGLELPAHVISVAGIANSTGWRANWVKSVAVRLKLDELDPRVLPNFSVSADLQLGASDEVATVPRESLFKEGGHTIAFVRSANGWEKREVEIGLTNNVAAEVKSGLNAGDVVAAEWPVTAANENQASVR